jgi:hypothetical protein
MRTFGHRIPTLGLLVLMAANAPVAVAQTVTVSPSKLSVPLNGKRRLTVSVSRLASRAVTWSVDGIPGGNAAVGTIDAIGNYTAPAAPPAGWTVTAAATSVADPTVSGTAAITVRNQIPWLYRVSPGSVTTGPFTLTVAGDRFMPGAAVRFNGVALETTFNGSNQLTASGTASQVGLVKITVANPGPDAVSGALGLTVRSPLPTRTATPTPRVEPSRSATARTVPPS